MWLKIPPVFSALLWFIIVGPRSGFLLPISVDNTLQFNFRNNSISSTVFIAIVVRNKAHVLPYFLTLLDIMDYPKKRLAIWIRSGHNEDNTSKILRAWEKHSRDCQEYHYLSVEIDEGQPYRQTDQEYPHQWTSERYKHIIKLKNEAIKTAQDNWADFIWFLDVDVLLTFNQTLRYLVSKKRNLAAPFLFSRGLNSNFLTDMKDYGDNRLNNLSRYYKEIFVAKKIGCLPVPVIHSAVLMNIRRKNIPDFSGLNETFPENDIIRLAVNAQAKNTTMEICNEFEYGFLISPLPNDVQFYSDSIRMQSFHVEVAGYWPVDLPVSEVLREFISEENYPPKSTLGFDKIYLINLKRRPERRRKMDHLMKLLGIDYTLIEAVDGRELTLESLQNMRIKPMEQYRKMYYNITEMTFGEIGCFLSHYRIWERMVKENITKVLILEDDARFEHNFVNSVQQVFEDHATHQLDWDLIYLGRIFVQQAFPGDVETFVENSEYLVHVGFSYSTIGYAMTLKGAKKLIDSKPLRNMVPVDEFLPIMYDKVRNNAWKTAFPSRNLKAFSTKPLLIYQPYSEANGRISDTEVSPAVPLMSWDEPSSSSNVLGTPYF